MVVIKDSAGGLSLLTHGPATEADLAGLPNDAFLLVVCCDGEKIESTKGSYTQDVLASDERRDVVGVWRRVS